MPTLVTTITKYIVYQTIAYILLVHVLHDHDVSTIINTLSHIHMYTQVHIHIVVFLTQEEDLEKVKVINNVDSVHTIRGFIFG